MGLDTYGPVLHIAPSSDEWTSSAPCNVTFLPNPPSETLIAKIKNTKPLAIVVGDQAIDDKIIGAWKEACPSKSLVLLRRGTSLDKICVDSAKNNGVRVVNTPGVNAPHVAGYVIEKLKGKSGELPKKISLLGCGNVGKDVIKKVLDASPDATVTILIRGGKNLSDLGLERYADRLEIVDSWDSAFEGAEAVAICLSMNGETTNRIDEALINRMSENGRIVCVSKPDVFSSDALKALAQAEGVELVIDYGPAILAAFRTRADESGVSLETWRNPPQLTTAAATSEACKRDLDYAVAVLLAIDAQQHLVKEELSGSFKIPGEAPPAGAPAAYVVGRGINGLFQALKLRLLGLDVTVFGRDDEGASGQPVNMRHFSASETMAKAVDNPYLYPGNRDLVIDLNRSGIELFEKLLEDNPELQQYVQKNVVRAYPHGEKGANESIRLQRRMGHQAWPSGKEGGEIREFSGEEFTSIYGIPGIERAIEVPGYDLEFKNFMSKLVGLLEKAGVKFQKTRLTPDEIAKLRESQRVIRAVGAEEDGVTPIPGWFIKLPAVGNEGQNVRGIKLQYELPVGVMNCRLDGENILVSGGQVPPGSSTKVYEQIKEKFLQAVRRHFPASFEQAEDSGTLDLFECQRPGSPDGLSTVERLGPNEVRTGTTYAAGTTQAAVMAAIAVKELANRSGVSFSSRT